MFESTKLPTCDTCKHILVKGQNKGQECRKPTYDSSSICSIHNKKAALKRKEIYQEKKEERKLDYIKNKEQIKLHYIKNKEQIKLHYIENKDKKKIYNSINYNAILINSCRNSDKKADREFNIDKDFINLMLNKQNGCCYHCNINLLLINGNRENNQISVDRVDNSIGHIKGNVVLSCVYCNTKKNIKSFESFGSNVDNVINSNTYVHIQ